MTEKYTDSTNKISGEGDIYRMEKQEDEEEKKGSENTDLSENPPPDRKICSINKRLLPLKIHFLFFFAGIASIVPYLPIFAKQLGISATGIGIVYFVIPVFSVIAKPLFGWMADKFKQMKLLVIIMILTTITFYVMLAFVPPLKEKPTISLTVGCDVTEVKVRQSNIDCLPGGYNRTKTCKTTCSKCTVKPDGNTSCSEEEMGITKVNVIVSDGTDFVLENSSIATCSRVSVSHCDLSCPCDKWCCHESRNEYLSIQFWCFFVSNVFAGMARRVLHSLSDSLCYDMLCGKTGNYGKQRLWGSIGRSVTPTMTGWLLDYTKHDNDYNYSVAIYLMVILLFLDILTVLWLDLSGNQLKENSDGIWKDVMSVFGDLKHLIFAASVTVNGVLCGLYFVYYFLFMEEIGASKLLIGISVLVRLVSEVPCFFFAGKIIAKIGHFNAVVISFIAFSGRFLSYIYIFNPRWILIAEVSHGFTFGFFYAAMTSYAKHCAPIGTEATLQGILGALFDGLGMAIGNILGGLGFDYFGSRTTFLVASIVSAISSVLTFVLHAYSIYRRKTLQKYQEAQATKEIEDEAYNEFDNML